MPFGIWIWDEANIFRITKKRSEKEKQIHKTQYSIQIPISLTQPSSSNLTMTKLLEKGYMFFFGNSMEKNLKPKLFISFSKMAMVEWATFNPYSWRNDPIWQIRRCFAKRVVKNTNRKNDLGTLPNSMAKDLSRKPQKVSKSKCGGGFW